LYSIGLVLLVTFNDGKRIILESLALHEKMVLVANFSKKNLTLVLKCIRLVKKYQKMHHKVQGKVDHFLKNDRNRYNGSG